MTVRSAQALWNGTLREGDGKVRGESGFFDVPYSFGSRFEEAKGSNPEELIAAAHAGCFSMFLSAQLTKEGHPPTRIQTTAKVHLEAGPTITRIELETEGVVTRVVYPETPVRIEYHLTEKGQDLGLVVEAISDWSARWACEESAASESPELVVISAN